MTEQTSVTPGPEPVEPPSLEQLAAAALQIAKREGVRALQPQAVDQHLGLDPGSTAAVLAGQRELAQAVSDGIFADDVRIWVGLGIVVPESVDDLVEQFVAFVTTLVQDRAEESMVRIELVRAFPVQARTAHTALRDMLEVMLDRLDVADPAARADLMLALIDGVLLHACSYEPGRPVDGAALGRAFRRILT